MNLREQRGTGKRTMPGNEQVVAQLLKRLRGNAGGQGFSHQIQHAGVVFHPPKRAGREPKLAFQGKQVHRPFVGRLELLRVQVRDGRLVGIVGDREHRKPLAAGRHVKLIAPQHGLVADLAGEPIAGDLHDLLFGLGHAEDAEQAAVAPVVFREENQRTHFDQRRIDGGGRGGIHGAALVSDVAHRRCRQIPAGPPCRSVPDRPPRSGVVLLGAAMGGESRGCEKWSNSRHPAGFQVDLIQPIGGARQIDLPVLHQGGTGGGIVQRQPPEQIPRTFLESQQLPAVRCRTPTRPASRWRWGSERTASPGRCTAAKPERRSRCPRRSNSPWRCRRSCGTRTLDRFASACA